MIELIHLHIPKTGGRSFLPILKSVYGDEVDGPRNRGALFLRNQNPTPLIELIPPNKRVLFGHLEYKHVKDIVERDNPKITTWLRDPVERVISNYYFNMKKYVETPSRVYNNFTNDLSLMEYARMKNHINEMSLFLEGLQLKDLFFIGTLENHDNDLETLAKKLKWKAYRKGVRKNDNSSFRKNPLCKTKVVTEEMREEIRYLNNLDEELYNSAIRLRKKNLAESRKENSFFEMIKNYVWK